MLIHSSGMQKGGKALCGVELVKRLFVLIFFISRSFSNIWINSHEQTKKTESVVFLFRRISFSEGYFIPDYFV